MALKNPPSLQQNNSQLTLEAHISVPIKDSDLNPLACDEKDGIQYHVLNKRENNNTSLNE